MKRLIIIHILLGSLLNIVANDFVPYRNVETTDDGVIVTYRFRGGIHQQDPLYPNAKYWKIPGFGLNEESGKPSTLSRWDSFAVPDGANATVEVLDCEYSDTAFVLAPARHALFESDTIGHTLETVPSIQEYAGFYPNTILKLGPTDYYRGQKIQKVEICPIQYDYINNIIRYYSHITYQVSFKENSNKNYESIADSKIKISPTDYTLNNIVLNPSLKTKRDNNTAAIDDNRDYLIISTPKYKESIEKFAEWKKNLGFRVHILFKDNWETSSIALTIRDMYSKLNLYYLLIVGDIDDVPSYSFYYQGSYVTDQYYARMANPSIFTSQISVGRIPVNNNDEANVIFDKIKEYEQYPTLTPTFYKTGLHCAFFEDYTSGNSDGYEDKRFTKTSEEIRDYMLSLGNNIHRVYNTWYSIKPKYWNNTDFSFGEEIPKEIQKPSFSWKGNKDSILNHIEEGCFYILYRGHGSDTSWVFNDPSYQFRNSNIQSLNNCYKFPVVFSITCKTGMFNSDKKCFAETFLSQPNGGCVGIFAATQTSYSGYNDVLAETMFDAIWPDSILRIKMKLVSDNREVNEQPVYELGKILNTGINYMNNIYVSTETSVRQKLDYTRDIFHLFGDPSMMIRTEVPQKFSPSIKRTNGVISVNANCDSTRISFYTPSTNQVDSYFGRTIDYPTTADSVIVCINKHNYIPFILNCDKNVYIQNETINDERVYVGENILIGKNVTTLKEQGEVLIQNANVKFQGKDVILQPGTTITNSNVEINADN